MKKQAGFSFIELMIVVAIIAILAKVGISSYSVYNLKSHRADAIGTLLSISMAEETYRASNTTYGSLAQVWGGVTTSPQGYYSLAISNVSASSYTITATAVGSQANDAENGSSCTPIVLAVSNGSLTKTPAACWPS